MNKEEIVVGQTVETDDGDEVVILDILPNTLIVYSDLEGIIIIEKTSIPKH